MLSHPLTFLTGYLAGAFALSFGIIGPLAALAAEFFGGRRTDRQYLKGLRAGISGTCLAFIVLHYLLYLRGYGITDWSAVWSDLFYPPSVF
ncbi:MAG TPA: hypothetical protein PK052_00630 [Anaerohalosphaeraceae bacterium]|nr:hypothetical protein [Anaerohalosphaeraceae bacterium]HOL30460.1 hypothetical protein [Anaerohalosphaeraceae bacterium]HOM76660.1 hypothetical protein [Anaerohalosphaeraceae bacterium]HPC64071.1 hypothetical protein [Anaerohalosphaeraceae bacterium]HPO70660.1 hypothetical protein [Anaerohalosphaeraceae bacterium]